MPIELEEVEPEVRYFTIKCSNYELVALGAAAAAAASTYPETSMGYQWLSKFAADVERFGLNIDM